MTIKVGIIGIGLIGGSIAKAFRKYDDIEILAYNRREESARQAFEDGACHAFTTEIDESFQDCDIIFICTPVDTVCDYVERLRPYISEDCILTDVGSTKKNIYYRMLSYKSLNFIGGHPMAGSEKTGYEAAKTHLFENAYYVMTPLPWVSRDKVERLQELVLRTGAIPIIMNPDTHDQTVAAISHLPHILASTLTNLVHNSDGEEKYMYKLAAGGFRDITRVASGSPGLWTSICLENKDKINEIINGLQKELQSFHDILKDGNADMIHSFFQSAKDYRDSFQYKGGAYAQVFDIKVDILDNPGSIANVAELLSAAEINIKNMGIINNRDFENGVLQIVYDSREYMEKSIRLLQDNGYTVYP